MRSYLMALVAVAALAACDVDGSDGAAAPRDQQRQAPSSVGMGADTMASHDSGGQFETQQIPDPVERPIMQAQVQLDRLGFTPGVVDGKMGLSTRNAIRGFQRANDLPETGDLDDATKKALQQGATIPATRVVTIPAEFAAGPFYAVPDEPEQQAKMERLGYASLDEKLAERFHTTVETLKALNPNGVPAGMEKTGTGAAPPASAQPASRADQRPPETASARERIGDSASAGFVPQPGPPSVFRAGQMIRVPNVGADQIDPNADIPEDWRQTLAALGVGTNQPKVEKIVVSKSKETLSAYDRAGKLVALFTATMGSTHDPLPLGNWKVVGVARNPPFSYNPELFWDVSDDKPKLRLPPGPNGPVGVVWIDLSKEHYGIHGTPDPETIGRAESHGCVRLTNWDAARLAQMVSGGTKVVFEE